MKNKIIGWSLVIFVSAIFIALIWNIGLLKLFLVIGGSFIGSALSILFILGIKAIKRGDAEDE